MRKQQETIQRFTDPFTSGSHAGNGQSRQGNGAGSATMQSASPGQGNSGGQAQTGASQTGTSGRSESGSSKGAQT